MGPSPAAHDEVPCVGIALIFRVDSAAHVLDQLKVERNGDPARDLVLQGEQIAYVSVEALGPQMRVALGIDQLGVDADLVARPSDASLQYIAHAKLTADLLRVD